MRKIFFAVAFALAAAAIFNSCSSKTPEAGAGLNSSRTAGTYTYSTTSNVGDYVEWTFNGTTISATWLEVSNTGVVNRTYNVNATCSTFNSTYGYYTCSINTSLSSCTAGALTCSGSPSGNIEMMEVPNTAIFVHTNGSKEQLHVGLIKDSAACATNVSGDYVFAKTGVGNRELFGVYRSDANLLNVTHADFRMASAGQTSTPTVTYSTQDASGAGTLTLTDGGCTSGVRTRTAGATTLRAMLTSSGLFILDLPSGQGGIVSFKTTNAAVIADFANKTFGGITFPDNGSPQPLRVVTGASSGTAVTISSGDANGTPITGADIRPLTNTTSGVSNPAYPNFTTAPAAGSFAYTANTNLQPTYGNPSLIPGLFRVDGSLGDSGRVMLAAAKLNGKIIAFGFVYNWRTSGQTNPSTGSAYSPDGLYNTGNFILFER